MVRLVDPQQGMSVYDGSPIWEVEHERILGPSSQAVVGPIVELLRTVVSKRRYGAGVEVHSTDLRLALSTFQRRDADGSVRLGPLPAGDEHSVVQVEIAPLETEKLAAAHASRRGQAPQSEDAIVGDMVEEGAQLGRRQYCISEASGSLWALSAGLAAINWSFTARDSATRRAPQYVGRQTIVNCNQRRPGGWRPKHHHDEATSFELAG